MLLALLEPPKEGSPRTIERCLQAAAKEGGVEFLVELWAESESR